MSMKYFDEMRDILCDHVKEVHDDMKQKGVTDSNLERAQLVTDTIKNIDKICIMGETGEYSQAGDWEAHGRFGDSYARNDGYPERGNSYGRRRDSMGRYSRDDGMSYGRSMRGRSYADGKDGMMEHFRAAMDEADTEDQRRVIRDAMERLKMA